jgi:hypothetical protein
MESKSGVSKRLPMVGILCSSVCFGLMIIFNVLNSIPDLGVFKQSVTNASDKYYLEITPTGTTFSIWGVIFTWHIIMLIYLVIGLCRKAGTPPVPVAFHLVYSLSMLATVAWLFTFDREFLTASCCCLFLTTWLMYACIGIAISGLRHYSQDMIKDGQSLHVKLYIGIILNALGIWAGWCTIASMLNLAIVLTYVVGVQQHIACTIVLSILAFQVIVYLHIDSIWFEKDFRFLFSPHFVLMWGLSGSLMNNWDFDNANSIVTVLLLSAAVLMTLVKIISVIVRERKQPLYAMPGKQMEKV